MSNFVVDNSRGTSTIIGLYSLLKLLVLITLNESFIVSTVSVLKKAGDLTLNEPPRSKVALPAPPIEKSLSWSVFGVVSTCS